MMYNRRAGWAYRSGIRLPEVHMSDKEKSLPKPPSSAFGRKRRPEENADDVPLMADRIALAAAEGRLEEFIKTEIPEGEHAKKLVSMMMGMTGMAQGEALKASSGEEPCPIAEADTPCAQPPEDVLKAVHSGDVQALMGLLERERRMRFPDERAGEGISDAAGQPAAEKGSIEKTTIDFLIKIAEDNDLGLEWVVMRALRVYVEEYRKTGRL
jgi:hypothetical protein